MNNTNTINITTLIELIKLSILKKNISDLGNNLKILDISLLNDDIFLSFLNDLLETSFSINNKTACEIIFDKWAEQFEKGNKIPFFTYLFCETNFRDEILIFLKEIYIEKFNLAYHIYNLLEYDESQKSEIAFSRLNDIYGELSLENYNLLYNEALNYENMLMYKLLADKIQQLESYAPIPLWVDDYTNSDIYDIPKYDDIDIPTLEKPTFSIPTTEEAVRILTQGLSKLGINDNELENKKDEMLRTYNMLTLKDKISLIYPDKLNEYLSHLEDDDTLFKIMGPANTEINANLNSDHICYDYGGHRMFFCNCFDGVDDLFTELLDPDKDWFIGYCEVCLLKIGSKFWAIRRPLVYGGWAGCFCSVECLNNHVEYHIGDTITMSMVNELERLLYSYGIQNRVPENLNEKVIKILITQKINSNIDDLPELELND